MVNLNGKLIQSQNATIALNNRGLNYGDAVFETLRISGRKVYFWKDHYVRLISSMQILKMEIPKDFSAEFLQTEILKTVKSSFEKSESYRIKLIVWRTTGGKYTPTINTVDYAILVEKLESLNYTLNIDKCEIDIFKDHHINSGVLSTLKTTNKIINVLGSIFAQENGFHNCLLLNEKNQIVEALNGNIFLITGNTIKTPPLKDGCLNGIMRKQLISILKEVLDYRFEEASISLNEITEADEIFITNVIQGIVPITNYKQKIFGREVTKKLLPKLNKIARIG